MISESELKELNADNGKYEANDVVGKTGIEKTMESTLQGKKGQKDVLVDNLGRLLRQKRQQRLPQVTMCI